MTPQVELKLCLSDLGNKGPTIVAEQIKILLMKYEKIDLNIFFVSRIFTEVMAESRFKREYSLIVQYINEIGVAINMNQIVSSKSIALGTEFSLIEQLTLTYYCSIDCSPPMREIPEPPHDIICKIAHYLWMEYCNLVPLLLVCKKWNQALKQKVSIPKKIPIREIVLMYSYYTMQQLFIRKNRFRHKHRQIGFVLFIGELYKVDMIPSHFIRTLLSQLLENEINIEVLIKFIIPIGNKLEKDLEKNECDKCFDKIHQMLNMPSISLQISKMIMEVIALRAANWEK